MKRSNWKMGKVVGLIRGKDGKVRGAKLKLITKGKAVFVNRALQKLYPLEVQCVPRECDNKTNGLSANPVGNEGDHTPSGREISRRAAAICTGKHEPCSSTNCLFLATVCHRKLLDLGFEVSI